MEFDNAFEVPLPPAEAWKVLLDIQRIAPGMHGAMPVSYTHLTLPTKA